MVNQAATRAAPKRDAMTATAQQPKTDVQNHGVESARGVLITLMIACLCYAAAAATGRPWVSWAAIPVGTAVVVVSEVAGAPWWAGLLVVSAAVVALGCLVGARRPLVLRQAAALVGFGAAALVALGLSPTAALVVGGLGLAAHGAWDAWHLARWCPARSPWRAWRWTWCSASALWCWLSSDPHPRDGRGSDAGVSWRRRPVTHVGQQSGCSVPDSYRPPPAWC
jgi:hypothetical protein